MGITPHQLRRYVLAPTSSASEWTSSVPLTDKPNSKGLMRCCALSSSPQGELVGHKRLSVFGLIPTITCSRPDNHTPPSPHNQPQAGKLTFPPLPKKSSAARPHCPPASSAGSTTSYTCTTRTHTSLRVTCSQAFHLFTASTP